MLTRRTDLALEAFELWRESAEATTRLTGVRSRERASDGYPVTKVEILNRRGEAALGRPVGTYVTIDLSAYWKRTPDFFPRAVRATGRALKAMLPRTDGAVLVVALGNADMTPDSVGPLAAQSVLVTRHLIADMPRQFAGFRPVAAFRTGVLGATGVETAEAVRGLAERIRPALVIAIDALASRRGARLCNTVQLSDTGILPGSGVGNHRSALDRKSLGVPVLAIGVPTVVDAVTLAADLLEEHGQTLNETALRTGHGGLMVTPQDIDAKVRELAKVVGYGVNWALQDLEVEDISSLLA
ncbi:MAG: GPR endopeptidase [Oscillibacter sp.]|nr:GPR endopeptidase [Oscillibacter sp.]